MAELQSVTEPEAPDDGPVDPFDDDTPLSCGIQNPEICESCQ